MKQAALGFLVMLSCSLSFAQKLPYVGTGQTFVFPSTVNKFVNAGNIIWALDAEEVISFADSKKIDNENIFNYLILKALPGNIKDNIKGEDLRGEGFEGYEHNLYKDYSRFSRKMLSDKSLEYVLSDTLKTFNFHEVFYLKDYALHCKVLAAGPMVNYSSGGVSLGLREVFYCCKNIEEDVVIKDNKDIVHIKRMKRTVNFDSIKYAKVIKQTYGLDIAQSIWHGAANGTIKLFDIRKQRIIPPGDVLNYVCEDSLKQANYYTGDSIVYNIITGPTVFPYHLKNIIEFTQDFYYDRNKNIFLTTISDCYLFADKWNDVVQMFRLEKRFRIIQ